MIPHVFISYVREDADSVDRLQRSLEGAGIRVWRDTADLWPGQDWRAEIRQAIENDALVFIACFSQRSIARSRSYQYEELILAIQQHRIRSPLVPWLLPVRLDECSVPDLDIGGGRTLTSLHYVDLFGAHREENVERLIMTVKRLLPPAEDGPGGDAPASAAPPPEAAAEHADNGGAGSSVNTLDSRTRMAALNYRNRLDEIKDSFTGRDELVDLVGIGILCREHILTIGPPGSAQTELLRQFSHVVDAALYHYIITRFTEPMEIFGPIDADRHRRGIFSIATTGMLAEARLAFLEEVLHGSSAIINTLMPLMDQRVFRNGHDTVTTPLITLIGSSSYVPDDPVVTAFSDRFLLRCTLDSISDDRIEESLRLSWDAERSLILASQIENMYHPPYFRPDELLVLHRAVADIELSKVLGTYARIVKHARAEGIAISDWRAGKAPKVFAAAAIMSGRGEAELTDLAWLVHMWPNIDDAPLLKRIAVEHGVPVA